MTATETWGTGPLPASVADDQTFCEGLIRDEVQKAGRIYVGPMQVKVFTEQRISFNREPITCCYIFAEVSKP